MESVRAFFALNLDVATVRRVVERLGSVAPDARSALESGGATRFVSPPKMHVTVKFLGAIDTALTPALLDAVGPLVSGPSPRLGSARAEGFPETSHARVLVCALDDPYGDLARFADAVDQRTTELGLPPEARPYRPHVTFARARRAVDATAFCDAVGALDMSQARVSELVLYRSDRSQAGSEYTALARWPWPAS